MGANGAEAGAGAGGNAGAGAGGKAGASAGGEGGTSVEAGEPTFEAISRLKGRVFESLALAASMFGILMLAVLLVYVFVDAFGLEAASPTWLLTYFGTLVLPFLGFCLYSAKDRQLTRRTLLGLGGGLVGTVAGFWAIEQFLVAIPRLSWQLTYLFLVVVPLSAYVTYVGSRKPVGRVGFGLLGRLLGGVGLGFALIILFVVFDPLAWMWAFALGVVPGVALVAFGRWRDTYASLLTVPVVLAGLLVATSARSPPVFAVYLTTIALPVAVVLGEFVAERGRPKLQWPVTALAVLLAAAGSVASANIGYAPEWMLIFWIGIPLTYVIYLWTLLLPVAVIVTLLTARESSRTIAILTGGAVLVVGTGGSLAATLIDISPETALLFLLAVGVPLVAYVRRILEDGRGRVGLLLPVLLAAGALAGAVIAGALDATGPALWLDSSFLKNPYSATPELAGFYPAIVGSVLIISMVAAFSFVLGVGTAIFLEEYTPDTGPLATVTRLVQINIANLAAVPSVVYGLLGLGVFINLIGFGFGTALTAALTLSLLILPITIISAQEAIRSVPDSLRNGSYAMGATRWQTTKNVVLPEALSGILTGTILSLGRAIGETAPLIMIGAPHVVFNAPNGILDKATAMPMQIFVWSNSAQTEFQYGVLAAGVVTLLVVLLGMNATAIVIRNRSERDS